MAWTVRRNSRRCSPDSWRRSLPAYSTAPELGVSRPRASRAIVVLPLPLSPTIAVMLAGSASIVSEKSLRAVTRRWLNIPPPLPNVRLTLRSSSSGALIRGGPDAETPAQLRQAVHELTRVVVLRPGEDVPDVA